MSLGLDEVVVVNIAVAPAPVGLKGFGSLLFVTPEAEDVFGADLVRTYTSLSAVQADFGDVVGSQAVKAATTYYAQTPTPREFLVGKLSQQTAPTKVLGGSHDTLSALKAITDGTLSFTAGATPVALTGLNLSGALSLQDVASIVSAAIAATTTVGVNAVSCLFNVLTDKFELQASIANATINVSVAATSALATSLGLTTAAGATTVASELSSDIALSLGAIEDVNAGFYGVALDKSLNDDEDQVLACADWCEASKKVFFNTTNDANTLTLGNTACVAAKLKAKTLSHTITSYTEKLDEYSAISIAGRAFTVNFEGTNTTITLFLKRGPTITALDLTKTEKTALEEKNCNAFLTMGGVNVFSSSRMADGGWFDSVHGVDWLQNRIQTDVFNLLYQSTTKIPYTDTGVGMIVQKVEQGLRQAVRNGLVAPGNTTDGRYLSKGYQITTVPVSEVSSADKGNRIYRGITFECVGAGALHNVEISGSFSE